MNTSEANRSTVWPSNMECSNRIPAAPLAHTMIWRLLSNQRFKHVPTANDRTHAAHDKVTRRRQVRASMSIVCARMHVRIKVSW